MRLSRLFCGVLLLVACENGSPPADEPMTYLSEVPETAPASGSKNAVRGELDSLRQHTSGVRFRKTESERFQVLAELYDLQNRNLCVAEKKYPDLAVPDFDKYLERLDEDASNVIATKYNLTRDELRQILSEAVAKNWYARMKDRTCS